MKTLILALDQGTTSSRAILFDKQGTIRAIAQKEFRQLYPKPGWVEHDPTEIWSSQGSVAREAMLSIDATPHDIAAIGITNQRETTIIWDRTSGKPIYPAIVWQDRRTAALCSELSANGHANRIREKTGLVLDAYFSGTKIKWILDEVPGARARAENGELAFGTVDSWLLWKLTGGKVHATDVSNASRTLLFNLHTLQWDPEILSLLDIPLSLLPEIRSNSEVFGYATALDMPEVPIAGMAGDQQSALFGQMCTTPGMAKNTYGTGCFMLMNTGTKIVPSNNNLLTTVAWQIQGQTHYALEGSVFIAGAAVQWLRDGLKMISASGETESLAATVPDTEGVVLVPAFTGLGAPHWHPHARGTIFGITRGTTDAHIARATLESIALQTWDVLKAMEMDAGMPIVELRVDGGATVNQLLMQFQADILGVDVIRPKEIETTALGAAYLAGLAVGFWSSTNEIASLEKTDTRFKAVMADAKKQQKLKEWQKAVQAVLAWST
ncbi:MAG: glycerol kinase GlpK [Saprospiraceae bacterium]|jgi:glycerol kinase|nr:glycerol kinase GlpK [Saprospiraceae bacterium]MDP4820170.1 glycerol kinase GlpK [Saprospiraceae bacterium]